MLEEKREMREPALLKLTRILVKFGHPVRRCDLQNILMIIAGFEKSQRSLPGHELAYVLFDLHPEASESPISSDYPR